MFGIGRRKSHRDLVKAELNESIEHFVQAASHAKGGVEATMGPRIGAAREYVGPTAAKVRGGAQRRWGSTMATLAPLAVAAADGARQVGTAAKKGKVSDMRKKKSSNRWAKMTGIVAAGAVVGAASAVAMRRRRETQEWNAYDPAATLPGIDTPSTGSTPATGTSTPAAETAAKVQDKAATSADKAASATASITETAKQTAGKTTETAKQAAGKAADKVDNRLDSAATASRNSHN